MLGFRRSVRLHLCFTFRRKLAAISLIAAVGDMMPPTALAGLFAAQVTGVEKYTKILKRCIVPIIILLVYACFFLANSKLIAGLF